MTEEVVVVLVLPEEEESDPWIGVAECVKGTKIWRDHKFANGACEHCGMRLQ
jgi:hypothetical protein